MYGVTHDTTIRALKKFRGTFLCLGGRADLSSIASMRRASDARATDRGRSIIGGAREIRARAVLARRGAVRCGAVRQGSREID